MVSVAGAGKRSRPGPTTIVEKCRRPSTGRPRRWRRAACAACFAESIRDSGKTSPGRCPPDGPRAECRGPRFLGPAARRGVCNASTDLFTRLARQAPGTRIRVFPRPPLLAETSSPGAVAGPVRAPFAEKGTTLGYHDSPVARASPEVDFMVRQSRRASRPAFPRPGTAFSRSAGCSAAHCRYGRRRRQSRCWRAPGTIHFPTRAAMAANRGVIPARSICCEAAGLPPSPTAPTKQHQRSVSK